MKRVIFLWCLFLTFHLTYSVSAQSHQGAYMHIDYLKVPAEQVQIFSEHTENTFKPLQKARQNSGFITSWSLYKVAYPGSQSPDYNYVIITTGEGLAGFEDLSLQLEGQISEEEQHLLLKNYEKHLIPGRSELWSVRNSAVSNESSFPARYIRMNFMNVALGLEYEYQMFEDEIAKPLHEDRMEHGRMRGWELYELILPGGTSYGYNFSTADYYEKLENIEFGFNEELIHQNHPDTNINEFFDNMYRTRELVRSELWELVKYLD